MLIKILVALLTVVVGVGVAVVLYYVLNKIAELLPGRWEERLKPYFYILPALAAIILYLVYPGIQTLVYSFANADSTAWVGFANYAALLTSPAFLGTLFTTLLWIILVPAATIAVGLVLAVLTDRLSPTAEKVAKTFIFLPMAISAVGAATIWRFVYATSPPSEDQIGLLNAVVTKFGGSPVAWLQLSTAHANSLLIMVVFMWMQVGYAMVLLSAAVKAVPLETIEAGRIDGANEVAIFFRVIIPQMRGTLITVFITVTIFVMKIFDIIYVMTDGNFNTNVVGVEFINQLFTNSNNGYAAAIVVLLMIAITPIMIYQVRHFRAEEAR